MSPTEGLHHSEIKIQQYLLDLLPALEIVWLQDWTMTNG